MEKYRQHHGIEHHKSHPDRKLDGVVGRQPKVVYTDKPEACQGSQTLQKANDEAAGFCVHGATAALVTRVLRVKNDRIAVAGVHHKELGAVLVVFFAHFRRK